MVETVPILVSVHEEESKTARQACGRGTIAMIITIGLIMNEKLARDVASYLPDGAEARWVGSLDRACECDGLVVDAAYAFDTYPNMPVVLLGDTGDRVGSLLRDGGALLMSREMATPLPDLLAQFRDFVAERLVAVG